MATKRADWALSQARLAAGYPSTLIGQIMMRPFHIAFALATGTLAAALCAQPAPEAVSAPPVDGSAASALPGEETNPPKAVRTIVIEKREKGQVTGATVSQGNNTYHLKPNAQVGSAQAGDAQSTGNRAAQWQILQFDWQRQPEKARPPDPPPVSP